MQTLFTGDPRVSENDRGGFTVYREGEEYHVLPTEVFNWTICHGPNLEFVPDGQGGFAIGIVDPDDALKALLGEPCVTANDDGTYTIADPTDDGDWTIRDTGAGWVAEHPHDGFDGPPFATAADAVTAVCGDPATAHRYGDDQ